MRLIQYERPAVAGFGLDRLANLQSEIDRLFDVPRAWAPALDVVEDKNHFHVKVELPGFKREDIEVTLDDGSLVISGERKVEALEEGVEVHRQERCVGKFARALTLPSAVVAEKINATYKDGILTVSLPKAEEAKPKTITVN